METEDLKTIRNLIKVYEPLLDLPATELAKAKGCLHDFPMADELFQFRTE
jgi:hypothetical protein